MISVECPLCPGRYPVGETCRNCGYDEGCVCCMLAVSKKECREPVYDSLTW